MPTITRIGVHAVLAAGVALLGGLHPAPAAAAQWRVQPFLDLGAIRDDNIRLTPGTAETTSGYVAAARFDAERTTEVSRAAFDAFIAHTRYPDSGLADKTEHGLEVDAERQTSERGTLGLEAAYRRNALFEEVLIAREGVGDVRDVDVALTAETQVRRHYRRLRPAWRWLLSERSRVELAYRFTDVGFSDRPATSDLIDYEEDLLSATYSRQLSPRDDLLFTANVVRYRAGTTGREADTKQFLIGRRRALSETLHGSVSAGISRTEERSGTSEQRSTGTVIDARLEQRAELSRLAAVVSRDVTPSGVGRALRTDQLRLHWERRIAPAVDFVLDARLLRSRVIEGTDPSANRRYYEVSPQLRWRWLEDLSVVAHYRLRERKRESAADTADSSAVFLGVSYAL